MPNAVLRNGERQPDTLDAQAAQDEEGRAGHLCLSNMINDYQAIPARVAQEISNASPKRASVSATWLAQGSPLCVLLRAVTVYQVPLHPGQADEGLA